MKKAILFALCLCALVITGCDKQDQNDTVLGTWQLTSYTEGTAVTDDVSTCPNYYLLLINDTAWAWQIEQIPGNFQTSFDGTYTVNNGVMTFTGSATGSGKLAIVQLADNKLVLNDASEPGFENGITGSPWSVVEFSKE